MKLLLVSLFLLFEFARFGHSQTDFIFLLDEVEQSTRDYPDLTVKINTGLVRGASYVTKELLVEYRMFNGWLGIPYAKPPTGPLRFKWPEPVEGWVGIKQTSTFPPVCYQLDSESNQPVGSEDCLYLNVFAPPLTTSTVSTKSRNLPVMVYIHPSNWASGSPRDFDPAALAIKTNTIVVAVQYRHNVFGYLYQNGTDEAPGNQAFGDQILALKWVKENIAAFGGDPTRVTLFGSNSGASSIGYHLVSPLSADLFTNVILQSGSVFTPNQPKDWQSASDAYTDLLYNLGCNQCTTEERIDCAREMNAKELLGIASLDKQPYGPVIDGYFLPYEPRIALLRGDFKKCPMLIGSNHDEANTFFYDTIPEYRNTTHKPDITFSAFRFYLRAIFSALFDGVRLTPSQEAATYFQYSNWLNRNDKNANFENLNNAFSDYLIRCPTVGMANLVSYYKQNVFYYSFTHVSSKSQWPTWFGAVNGAEQEFVSGLALYKARGYTPDERDLANQMIKYWSNFAKHGNPNGKLSNEKPTVEWPPYILRFTEDTIDQREYLNLNGQQIQLGLNFKAEQCGFWLNLIPKLKVFSVIDGIEQDAEDLANFY